MAGFDRRDIAYQQARSELLREMLSAGAFELDEHDRGSQVARMVDDIARRHPDLDDHLTRRLRSEGMTARYGDATLSIAAGEGRGDDARAEDLRAHDRRTDARRAEGRGAYDHPVEDAGLDVGGDEAGPEQARRTGDRPR